MPDISILSAISFIIDAFRIEGSNTKYVQEGGIICVMGPCEMSFKSYIWTVMVSEYNLLDGTCFIINTNFQSMKYNYLL